MSVLPKKTKDQEEGRDMDLQPIKDQLTFDWPNNRTINIVCHGHSVPAGYFKTPDVRPLESYPHLLRAGLATLYPHSVVNVIVSAIGGENSESGAVRFDRDVMGHRPDVLTIDYALNDRRIGLERARAAWFSMIRRATDAGVKVLLLTPTPVQNFDFDHADDDLNQHAAQVRQLAKDEDCGLVDSLAAFGDAVKDGMNVNDLLSQINHPNAAGHALVGEALLRWFR
jgi:acyl-CoA thioesterase-1